MKIFGIFRGFPGLGRVVSGIGLLDELRRKGHSIKAYSYLQGNALINEYGIDRIIDDEPCDPHIMVIGLNPISKEIGKLFDVIQDEKPDLIIIDGEPLITSTLSTVYPRERIVCLLNPSDIENDSLPVSSINFYRHHYLTAKHVLVHSFINDDYKRIADEYNCNIYSINTIIRPEILKIKTKKYSNTIIGILGGGCAHCSVGFLQSTIKVAINICKLSKLMKDYNFVVYCNDLHVKSSISNIASSNFKIIDTYASPQDMYENACAAICRAGRNTTSELLYLGIPMLLFAAGGDFRSVEQGKNIRSLRKISHGLADKVYINEDINNIKKKMEQVLKHHNVKTGFLPGNSTSVEIIGRILQ